MSLIKPIVHDVRYLAPPLNMFGPRPVTIGEIERVLTLVKRYDVTAPYPLAPSLRETENGGYVKYADVLKALRYLVHPHA